MEKANILNGQKTKLITTALVILLLHLQTLTVSAEWVSAQSGLNLRAQTSLKAKVLALMPYGTELEVTRTIGIGSDIWADVEYNGQRGYCKMEYLSKEDPFDGMTCMGEWRITAYAYTGNPCANGQYPTIGYTVACNSLPFGTKIYIDGVGFRTVEDRGPSQMGDSWCDLYLGNTAECIQWGNQYRKVWVTDE